MKAQDEFMIPYQGLSEGIHSYNFEIGKLFLNRFEKSKIKDGVFEVKVDFDKQGRMVVLTITGDGHFSAPCDRCLATIEIPISYEDQVILKFSDTSENRNEEVFYLDAKTSHIDLSPYIFESLHLNLPIRNVRDCEMDNFEYCDQKALNNLGLPPKEEETKEEESPWSKLNNLDLE